MAVNKNFIVRNGLEVDESLIFANADTQKVGIGTTTPEYELDVVGKLRADNAEFTGIVTAGLFDGPITTTEITTVNLEVTGISTLNNVEINGLLTAGGTTGQIDYYLANTGAGVTWKSFRESVIDPVTFTATEGQSLFTLDYEVGLIEVYLNGVRLTDSEFSALTGSTITLIDPAFEGDTVDFVRYSNAFDFFQLGDINIDTTGVITATAFVGDGSELTNLPIAINIEDSDSAIGIAGTINFGTNLSVSALSAGVVTVTASGGGSGYWEQTDVGIHTLSSVGIGTTNPTQQLEVLGDTKLDGNVHLPDDRYLRFGAADGSDMYISHVAGSNTIFTGIGDSLKFRSSTINFKNPTDNEFTAKFIEDGAVELYYDNSKKFETTGYGVSVTGGMNVSGVVTAGLFDGPLTTTGIVTATSFSGSGSNLTGLTGASANTYGSEQVVPQIVVDGSGRITSITNVAISTGGGPGGGVTSLTIKDSDLLVGTANTINFGTGLSVSPVSSGIVTVTGITTANINAETLNVTGISTFSSIVNLDAGVNVTGVITATELDVNGDVNVTGISTFSSIANLDAGVNVTGVITATELDVNGDVNVTGISTFSSIANLDAGVNVTGGVTVGTGATLDGSINTITASTNGSERLRIGSAGQIGLGGANYGTSSQVLTSNGSGSAPTWQTLPFASQEEAEAGISSTTVMTPLRVAQAIAVLGGSVINNIQRGTISITVGTGVNTATIVGVNTSKTMISYLGNRCGSTDPRAINCTIELTDGTTLTARRNDSSNTAVVSFEVIEFV